MKLLCLSILILLSSCRSENTQSRPSQTKPKEIEIPSDFLSFYDRYHSDSLFQLAHTVFPVKSAVDTVVYYQDDWIMHKPFNSQGGNYIRTFNNINGIIIEFVNEKTGFVNIERRFSKMGDDYNLIYYNIKTQFDN